LSVCWQNWDFSWPWTSYQGHVNLAIRYSLTMLHGFNDLIFLFAWYWDVFVFWKVIFEKLFFKLSCVYLLLEKLINEKYFLVKKNLAWFPGKCFPFILDGKHFLEVVKNLEISYYLLIISNLILKLLIAIYILFWILFFNFIP